MIIYLAERSIVHLTWLRCSLHIPFWYFRHSCPLHCYARMSKWPSAPSLLHLLNAPRKMAGGAWAGILLIRWTSKRSVQQRTRRRGWYPESNVASIVTWISRYNASVHNHLTQYDNSSRHRSCKSGRKLQENNWGRGGGLEPLLTDRAKFGLPELMYFRNTELQYSIDRDISWTICRNIARNRGTSAVAWSTQDRTLEAQSPRSMVEICQY